MVIVKLSGGLGNQLFQYAAGRALSLRLGTNLLLDANYYLYVRNRHYILDIFQTQGRKTFPFEVVCRRLFENIQTVREKKYYTYDRTFGKIDGNVYMDGWWQNPSYFQPYKKTILKELTLKAHKERTLQKNSVSIHVRRGDYTVLSDFGVCSPEYYKKAIRHIKKTISKPVFYVFSDDIHWARQNLSFIPNPVFVTNQTEIEDLAMMSQCTHHIIANSTFSWWASALAANQKGITIAPRPWVSYEKKESQHLYKKNWVVIARN